MTLPALPAFVTPRPDPVLNVWWIGAQNPSWLADAAPVASVAAVDDLPTDADPPSNLMQRLLPEPTISCKCDKSFRTQVRARFSRSTPHAVQAAQPDHRPQVQSSGQLLGEQARQQRLRL